MPDMPPCHRRGTGSMPTTRGRAEARKFRNTRRWRKLRNYKIAKHPLCEFCGQPAEQVHHVKPIHKAPELAYEFDNLISVCVTCHNRVEDTDERPEQPGFLEELGDNSEVGVGSW